MSQTDKVNAVSNIIVKKRYNEMKKQMGFWLDNDVATVLIKVTDEAPRGAKSQLVNDALRRLFEEEGYL